MGKMLDNFRAFWNNLGDALSDPAALAQLKVSDLEKAIAQAKDAAAPVIGRPPILKEQIRALEKRHKDTEEKIIALLDSGREDLATPHANNLAQIESDLEDAKGELTEAETVADEWRNNIKVLEDQLVKSRSQANKMGAESKAADATIKLGKTMGKINAGSAGDMSAIQAKIDQKKMKAAGYSDLNGMSAAAEEARVLRDAGASSILDRYKKKPDDDGGAPNA